MSTKASKPDTPWIVRPYQSADQAVVDRLYNEGLLVGAVDPRDSAADIENIHEAYFSDSRDGFWVAQVDVTVVGTIAVAHEVEHTAQVRRLRVDKAWQQSELPQALIEMALHHCRHTGYLKVVFETRFERSATMDLFAKLGFHYTRARNISDRELLEFYLDLYQARKHQA